MDGIHFTLKHLSLTQMVLGWLFVAAYALALSGMLGATGSLRAGLAAVLAAVAFAGLSENWVAGALLIAFGIGGMAFFVVLAWLLMRICAWFLERGQQVQPVPSPHQLVLPPKASPVRPAGTQPTRQPSHVSP